MNQTSAFAKRLLTEGTIAYFCTTDTRNNPHIVPAFFIFDLTECHAHFLFDRDSEEIRNLRSRPQISFAVDVRDHNNPVENKGVMVKGETTLRESNRAEVEMERVKQLFEEKYGWSPSGNFVWHDHDECLVDVTVKKISCWQGAKFLACPKFCVAPSRSCAPMFTQKRLRWPLRVPESVQSM